MDLSICAIKWTFSIRPTSYQGCLSELCLDFFPRQRQKSLSRSPTSSSHNSLDHPMFISPRHHRLIPSRGRLSGFQGRSSSFSNHAHCRRGGSALLGNYENPVTGFKWWSCVCRECTASVYITASPDWWLLSITLYYILIVRSLLDVNYLEMM